MVRVVGKVGGRWQLVTVWSTCQAGERHRDRRVYNAITCSRIGRTCDNWRASSYAVNKRNVPRTNCQVKSIKASCLQRGWKVSVERLKKMEDVCPEEGGNIYLYSLILSFLNEGYEWSVKLNRLIYNLDKVSCVRKIDDDSIVGIELALFGLELP